jgi:predicted ATPase
MRSSSAMRQRSSVRSDRSSASSIAASRSGIEKSLIAADIEGSEPRLRLLGSTRAYALEKLAESGEDDTLARRNAEHY